MASEGARPGLRERKKREVRTRIADAARGLFAASGFEAVTVADVARAADVSTQTVFNHFPTKEDLVFWRLGDFEDHLVAAIRDRPAGEPAAAAFRRYLLGVRGLLRSPGPGAHEQLVAVARVIDGSPALRAREQQIFAAYTDTLARILAAEAGGEDATVAPWVVANALTGVHRALVAHARRRLLEGARHPALAEEVRAQADAAFAVLERGLG
ncbi:MAG TPA: TetR/AcrR family transcriptional regulator [Capillimicrobium sp.]